MWHNASLTLVVGNKSAISLGPGVEAVVELEGEEGRFDRPVLGEPATQDCKSPHFKNDM